MHSFFSNLHGKLIRESILDTKQILDYIINNYDDFTPNWHALGFIHCKLVELKEGTLRLHIWDNQEKHAEEQLEKIHDHLFSLNSFVISGKIKNEVFKVIEVNDNEFTHHAYTVKYDNRYSSLVSNNRLYKVTELNEEVITDGQYYKIDSSSFHRSSLANDTPALTLVATYDHLPKNPITLSSNKIENHKIRYFHPYDKIKWRDTLIKFRANLI